MQILDKKTLPSYLKTSGLIRLFEDDFVIIPKTHI